MVRAARCGAILLLILLASGCSAFYQAVNSTTQPSNLYLPPNPAGLSTPSPNSQLNPVLPLNTPEPPQLTPFSACLDSLVYIADLTIPDGSIAKPREVLDKQWKVENAGTCNWESEYRLQLIAGPALDAPSPQALYPARSGSAAIIRIVFTAPTEPGRYRSAWQAFNPQGEPFGDPIFIEFEVEAPTPTPTP